MSHLTLINFRLYVIYFYCVVHRDIGQINIIRCVYSLILCDSISYCNYRLKLSDIDLINFVVNLTLR